MATKPTHSRAAIRQTLLVNLAFKAAFDFSGDTAWEEVTCVGYNPAQRQLTAVVSIKQTTGYSGGLCDARVVGICPLFRQLGRRSCQCRGHEFRRARYSERGAQPAPPDPVHGFFDARRCDAPEALLEPGSAARPSRFVMEHASFAQSERIADFRQFEGRAYSNRARAPADRQTHRGGGGEAARLARG